MAHSGVGRGVRSVLFTALSFALSSENFWNWSEPSDYIMPIAQPLIGVAADMQKAAHKGLPYVLRSMVKNSTISEPTSCRSAWHVRMEASMHLILHTAMASTSSSSVATRATSARTSW